MKGAELLYIIIASQLVFSPVSVFATSHRPTAINAPSVDDARKFQEYIRVMAKNQAARAALEKNVPELTRYRNALLGPHGAPTPAANTFSRAIANHNIAIKKYTAKILKARIALRALGKITGRVLCIFNVIGAYDDWMRMSSSEYCRKENQAAIDDITQQIDEIDKDIKDIKQDIANAEKAYNDALAIELIACELGNNAAKCDQARYFSQVRKNELDQLEKILKELKAIHKTLEDLEKGLEDEKYGIT